MARVADGHADLDRLMSGDFAGSHFEMAVCECGVTQPESEREFRRNVLAIEIAIADVNALGVVHLQILAGVMTVGRRIFETSRKGYGQFAGGASVTEQNRGQGMAAFLSAVPHVE